MYGFRVASSYGYGICPSTNKGGSAASGVGGVVEHVSQNPFTALVRLDQPGPGAASLGACNFGAQSMVTLNFYLYGDHAAATVARETPLWQAWIQEHFPAPPETSKSE